MQYMWAMEKSCLQEYLGACWIQAVEIVHVLLILTVKVRGLSSTRVRTGKTYVYIRKICKI